MTKRTEEKAPSALNTAAAVEASAAPTVGRIVHYLTGAGPKERENPVSFAAIVTRVDDAGDVSLFVMHPDGAVSSVHNVKQGTVFGSWCWPPRV